MKHLFKRKFTEPDNIIDHTTPYRTSRRTSQPPHPGEQIDTKIESTPCLHPKILFILLQAVSWPSVSSAWEAANKHKQVTARAMIIPSTYKERMTRDFTILRHLLIEKDVPFEYFSVDSILAFKPDVIFVPVPYKEMLPASFWEAAEQVNAKLAYVPYGLEVGGGGYNLGYQFNLDLHNQAWRIFARSKNHRKMYARYKKTGSSNVVVTGTPRYDAYSNFEEIDITSLSKKIAGRTAILWTPHFTVRPATKPPEWSSFFYVKDHLLKLIAERPATHFLIFRPHPLLFIKLVNEYGWTHQDLQSFKDEIRKIENVYLDENAEYLPSFKASSGLIADAGSFLLEYFLVDKPILYTCEPNGLGLNDDEKYILQAVSNLGDNPLDSLKKFIEDVSANNDRLKTKRKEMREQLFYIPPCGHVGEEIINHIVDALAQSDDAVAQPHLSLATQSAEIFWLQSDTSYLGTPEYYERQEKALYETLCELGNFYTALDIGCSDGRYTLMLAKFAEHVTGIDISQSSIDKARRNLSNTAYTNVEFRTESIRKITHAGRYNLITCMGVLSGIIDEAEFAIALSHIRAMLQPAGTIIFKESLSTLAPRYTEQSSEGVSYTAIYRSLTHYLHAIELLDLELIKDIKLADDTNNHLENHLFVFKCNKGAIHD